VRWAVQGEMMGERSGVLTSGAQAHGRLCFLVTAGCRYQVALVLIRAAASADLPRSETGRWMGDAASCAAIVEYV
jgi:hypothetical protein